jgi:hypothetical protein
MQHVHLHRALESAILSDIVPRCFQYVLPIIKGIVEVDVVTFFKRLNQD